MFARIRPLLFLLAVIVGLKLLGGTYSYLAYGEERALVKVMRVRLVDSGAEVTRTRAQLDSLRRKIEAVDVELDRDHHQLQRYRRHAVDGALPSPLYEEARALGERYNRNVERHNQWLRRYHQVLTRNHVAVDSYNALADSVRNLATVLGDPYYPVPSPVEAAVERGLIKAMP